jgi:ATP-binding cassette, subfamily B, bacterial HlyB/CyaB
MILAFRRRATWRESSRWAVLVTDLFFTFIFLAVMYFYLPLLTWIVLAPFPFYIAISAAASPRRSAAG